MIRVLPCNPWPTFLNAAEEQEDQDDHNDEPEASAGPIAPTSAIGP